MRASAAKPVYFDYLWQRSINTGTAINPYVVDPGQSVSIPVTITPQGKPGSTVTGTIFLDDTSLPSPTSTPSSNDTGDKPGLPGRSDRR